LKDAGGKRPNDSGFAKTMKSRADGGLIQGVWSELERSIKKIAKSRLSYTLKAAKKSDEDNSCSSKIGGYPYATAGEIIPKCIQCSKEMDFAFQIDVNDEQPEKIPNIGLLVLYICKEGCYEDSDSDSGTYEVRNYRNFPPEQSAKPSLKTVQPYVNDYLLPEQLCKMDTLCGFLRFQ
jgi:uncharacterized protein YwqG